MNKQIQLEILKSILDGRKRLNDEKVQECLMETRFLTEQYTKLAEKMAEAQVEENAESNLDHAYSDVCNV